MSKPAEDRYQEERPPYDINLCLTRWKQPGMCYHSNLPSDPPVLSCLKILWTGQELIAAQQSRRCGPGTLRLVMVSTPESARHLWSRNSKSVFSKNGWFVTGKYDALKEAPHSGIRRTEPVARILTDERSASSCTASN
jgi:hypothetical protein